MTALHRLPAFADPERELVHVVVECPRGATAKLKFDEKLGAMTLSRPLPAGVAFPYDFGFVPSTKAPDGDPLDALIVGDAPTYPGVVVVCRPIAVVQATQTEPKTKKRVRNDRVLFVAAADHRVDEILNVGDIAPRTRDELAAFFIAASKLEGKEVAIEGWTDAKAAMKTVRNAHRKR